MGGIDTRTGWKRRLGLVARALLIASALLAAQRAEGLPLLKLYLPGDVDRLGMGGGSVFRDLGAEALRLERPTLLNEIPRPIVTLSFTNEEILTLRSGEWAGTEAFDRKLDLTLIAPLAEVMGVPLVGFASVRHEVGRIHLQNRERGPLVQSDESRNVVTFGLSSRLPWGLSLAAGLEGEPTSPGWLVEARYQASPLLSTWFRRRVSAVDYEMKVPDGVATNIRSPELRYRIDNWLEQSELGAQVGDRELIWALGAVQVEGGGNFWVEAGGKPLPWLALRGGADRELFRLNDPMDAQGTGTIARVDFGMRYQRTFGGVDVEIPRGGIIEARYVHSTLAGATSADEVGTGAARAFLQVDYDMGLFFKGHHRLEGDQIAVGYRRGIADGVDFAVGAQYLSLALIKTDFAITSDALQRSLAEDDVDPARMGLVGLTGAVYVPMGRFRLAVATGQFVPVSVQQARQRRAPPAPRPDPPRREDPKGPYEWLTRTVGDAVRALDDAGGGNRLMLRLSTEF